MLQLLLIEDDLKLTKIIKEQLNVDFIVETASCLETAYEKLEKKFYHLVLTDRLLGDEDSLEIIEFIRQESPETKIICISQLDSEVQRVAGLTTGADDYLPKPFSLKELQIKLHKLSRLQRVKETPSYCIGEASFNYAEGTIYINNKVVILRKKETDLLYHLYCHRNHIVSRENILEAVWKYDELPTDGTLDVYISRLRDKLDTHGSFLKTARGYGYSLVVPKVE